MAKAKTTAVAKRTAASLPAEYEDFMGGSTGLENVTAKDIMIPRIVILQSLSPQLDKKKPEFIKGAQVGDFCDTATGEFWRDEFLFIPVFFATVYLEWKPKRAGMAKNHGTDPSILSKTLRNDRNQNVLKNSGNIVAETATWYGLNGNSNWSRCFFPFTSTGLKDSRLWMTQLTRQKLPRGDGGEFTPPIFYRSWLGTTVEKSNDQGSWIGSRWEPSETINKIDPSKALLAEAKDFCDQAKKGLVQGDFRDMDREAEQGDGGAM
jgi:hypothetical protein